MQEWFTTEEQIDLEGELRSLVDDLPVKIHVDVAGVTLYRIKRLRAHRTAQVADACRFKMQFQRRIRERRRPPHPVVHELHRTWVDDRLVATPILDEFDGLVDGIHGPFLSAPPELPIAHASQHTRGERSVFKSGGVVGGSEAYLNQALQGAKRGVWGPFPRKSG